MNDLLTVTEVAAWLGVRCGTVRRHVKAGRLPVIALNRRLHRFDRADVLAFIRRGRITR